MKKRNQATLVAAIALLVGFALWTALVQLVDVAPIGPESSSVGFATLNGCVHDATGVHMGLYTVTDWLGLVPIATVLGFAIFGLAQWIRRKSLLKVDRSLFCLGGFYIVVLAVYILFELVVVNRRPVLINGYLEASYPSSTTMLALCVMPTAAMQIFPRIKSAPLRWSITGAILLFTLFMVLGRLLSGVHWLTDIIGGGLCSAGLVMLYAFFTNPAKGAWSGREAVK